MSSLYWISKIKKHSNNYILPKGMASFSISLFHDPTNSSASPWGPRVQRQSCLTTILLCPKNEGMKLEFMIDLYLLLFQIPKTFGGTPSDPTIRFKVYIHTFFFLTCVWDIWFASPLFYSNKLIVVLLMMKRPFSPQTCSNFA